MENNDLSKPLMITVPPNPLEEIKDITKRAKKLTDLKTMLDNLYSQFEIFCDANKQIKPKVLLPFYMVHTVNLFHIYKKWSKTFIKHKHYIAEKFANNPQLAFDNYTMQNGVLISTSVKISENFTYASFVTKLNLLKKVYDKITTYLNNGKKGQRLFNQGFDINGCWYNGVAEYYAQYAASKSSDLQTCSIKFLFEYSLGLPSHDLNKFLRLIAHRKISNKIVYVAIASSATAKAINENVYPTQLGLLITTCFNLIVKSNVGIASICDEMMRCSLISAITSVDLIQELIEYRQKIGVKLNQKNMSDYHKNILKEVINTAIFLVVVTKSIKEEENDDTKATKLSNKLGNEFGIACRDRMFELKKHFDEYCQYQNSFSTTFGDPARSVRFRTIEKAILDMMIGIYDMLKSSLNVCLSEEL